MFQKYRKVILIIWGIFLIAPFAYYLYSPDTFSPQNISEFIREFETHLLLTYLIISIIRGVTLIPPTVIVLAGILLSPDKPYSILIISLLGIIISSSFIYYFSKKFEIDKYFEIRFPEKIIYVKKKINSKYGWGFVLLWCCFPIVPSDLIFYVSGILKMDYKKFISAVIIGQSVIFSFWIFIGNYLFKTFNLY